ncbi:alpha/beta hydrolase [Catalinimonas niigatensis]|uniref:alpha/beta hydrolase n=1 Tax=Catalinimonas niigatensis TaxID=1397264 RepID=UPI002665C379|nr:alpha/beta hydrolase [Catalinimonas niigatensis]WPP48718.1 alpha/beta hydrolase [Catalinimonas niigatensis]
MNYFNVERMITSLAITFMIIAGVTLFTISAKAQTDTEVKNIILVHGAFIDGSGWQGVYQILTEKGYNVTVTQNSLSSLEADVETLNRAIERQNGPVILVGHSYGGSIITEGGNSDKVAGLVYVAAFQPDEKESALNLAQSAPDLSNGGILPPDDHGMLYYNKAKFHQGFAADLGKKQAEFMWASQGAFAAQALAAPMTAVAWKTKPTWVVIATEDKAINPALQRRMSERSGAAVTEVKASHAVFISQPKAVAQVIESAAQGALTAKN